MVLMPSVRIDTVNHHQNERLVVYADDVGQSEFPKVFLHVSVRADPGCLLHFDPKHHGAGLVASHLLALQLIQVDKKHIFFPLSLSSSEAQIALKPLISGTFQHFFQHSELGSKMS